MSSVWPGLKWAWNALKDDVRWCVGDGTNISVWFDTWIGETPLINQIGKIAFVQENINMKVSELLNGTSWAIPVELQPYISNTALPEASGGADLMVWSGSLHGGFSTASAMERIRQKEPELQWPTQIWKTFLHPSIAGDIWKLNQKVYVDDEVMRDRGFEMVSRCCVCVANQDSMDHTLWHCKFSEEIWDWLCQVFKISKPNSFSDICKLAQNCSPLVKQVWMTSACVTMRELWFQKNRKLFENIEPNSNNFKNRILQCVNEGGNRMKGTRWGQQYDSDIIFFFRLGVRNTKYSCIKEIFWTQPRMGYILFCCDGASFGNPWNAGFGICARDHLCQVVGTISGGIGVATNYMAEIFAVLCALEWAVKWGFKRIIISSDSKTVINQFSKGLIPWCIRARWFKAFQQITEVHFQHYYREINFSADSLAKRGAVLAAGERVIRIGRPLFLKRVEMPEVPYYRFNT